MSPLGLFPGLQPNTALDAAVSWRSVPPVSEQMRRRINRGISLPFPCTSSAQGCNSRMEVNPLSEQEFDMLTLDFVKKTLRGSNNTSVRISGAANQNIGSLGQQEKPTAMYPFTILAGYNILDFKML